jgi:carbon monoxide dehydrogenase subunit G
MVTTIVIVFLVLIAALLAFAATKPNSFRVQRSARINAPREKIFPLLNDFHNWGGWSPWEKLDPDLKRTYSGAAGGKGSVYEWEGNRKVGHGRMEILESSRPGKVVIKLDFLKPFEAHNTAEFTLEGKSDTTNVTWAMHGPQPFVGKLMTVFFSMDRVVGNDFETGLENLKAIAEK